MGYMTSLEKMESAVLNHSLTTLYPAHGPTIEKASAKLKEYKAHRQQRIDQVQKVLQEASATGMTCEENTRSMYKEVPERLIPAAAGVTMQVLLKLEHDSIAVRLKSSQDPKAFFGALGATGRWALRTSKM